MAHFTFDSEQQFELGIDLQVTDYSTGMIRGGEAGFHVLTGIDAGRVGVTIEVLNAEPKPDTSDWEDVVEFPLTLKSRAAVLHDYFDTRSAVRVDLRMSGRLMVRVSAHGRDVALDSASMMDELYRLQFWLADTARSAVGSRVIKADSEASAFRLRTLQPAPGGLEGNFTARTQGDPSDGEENY